MIINLQKRQMEQFEKKAELLLKNRNSEITKD
jgi:hypothetical protein